MSECKHEFIFIGMGDMYRCKKCGLMADSFMAIIFQNERLEKAELKENELQAQVAVLTRERYDLQVTVEATKQEIINTRERWFKKYQFSCSCESAMSIRLAEVKAYAAVLIEALRRIREKYNNTETDICTNIQAMYEETETALAVTPPEVSERVQEMTEALEYYAGKTRDSHKARVALAEWRRDKCSS